MKEKSNAPGRRKYDAEFKAEVLRMVATGRPVTEIAQALGIGDNLIYRWRSKAQKAAVINPEMPSSATGSTTDLLALQKRIQQLEAERDILKKALAIFSRQI
jgi:transposase